MGCDVIDKIFNRGFEQGFEEGFKQGQEEGMEQVALLMKKLFAQKRIEDVKKACKDKQYLMQLMKEFDIIQPACTRSPSSSCPKTSAYPSNLPPCKPDTAHGEYHA